MDTIKQILKLRKRLTQLSFIYLLVIPQIVFSQLVRIEDVFEPIENGRIGYSVDIYDHTYVAGAPSFYNIGGTTGTPITDSNGKIYIGELNSGVPNIEFTGPNLFGFSVSIHGNYLAVGSPGENGYLGKVYIYEKIDEIWGFSMEIDLRDFITDPSIRNQYKLFGARLKLYGNYLAIATLSVEEDLHRFHCYCQEPEFEDCIPCVRESNCIDGRDTASGINSVFLFQLSDELDRGVRLIGEPIVSSAIDGKDHFGNAIEMNNNHLFIGAPGTHGVITENRLRHCSNPTPGVLTEDEYAGKVYIYSYNESGIEQVSVLENLLIESRFGETLALNEDYLAVGAPGFLNIDETSDLALGAVYIYSGVNDIGYRELFAYSEFRPRESWHRLSRNINNRFGMSIDMNSRYLLVTAPSSSGEQFPEGKVYLLDYKHGYDPCSRDYDSPVMCNVFDPEYPYRGILVLQKSIDGTSSEYSVAHRWGFDAAISNCALIIGDHSFDASRTGTPDYGKAYLYNLDFDSDGIINCEDECPTTDEICCKDGYENKKPTELEFDPVTKEFSFKFYEWPARCRILMTRYSSSKKESFKAFRYFSAAGLELTTEEFSFSEKLSSIFRLRGFKKLKEGDKIDVSVNCGCVNSDGVFFGSQESSKIKFKWSF